MARFIRNLIIVIILLAGAYFILQKMEVIPSIKNIFAPKPVVIDNSPILIKQIKEIAQLMTIEYYDEVVVDSSKLSKAKIPITVYPLNTIPFLKVPQIVLIVKGKVIAGMDLQQLNTNAIQITDDSIHIQLPKAKILEVVVNPSDVETFIEKGTWTPNEVTTLKMKAESKMIADALQQHVITKANEKGKDVIRNLMQSTGYKKIGISTAP